MFRRLFMAALALTVMLGGFGVVFGGALEQSHHYTWGINNPQAIDLASGRIISEVVLKFHNFRSESVDTTEIVTSEPSSGSRLGLFTEVVTTIETPNYDSLSIYVLDNPRYGFQSLGSASVDPFVGYGGKLIKGVLEQVDSERYNLICRLGDTHSDDSPFSSLFDAPVALTLADNSSILLSSALLEFIDYAGTGPSAGFGIWPGNVRYDYDDITLTLTVQAYQGSDYATQTLTFHIGDDMNPIDGNPVQPEIYYALDVFAVNGTVVKSPDQATYAQGGLVTLTATAAAGYTFAQWSGDAAGTNSSITITMDGDKSVTANFTQNATPTYTVTFNLDGKGTRTGGGALTQTIAHGAAATAPTVAANTGWVFTGWDKTFNNITGNLTVNAQYTAQTYTVTFNLDGKGTRTGGGALVQTIAHGTAATAPTVAANTGWNFTGWDKTFNNITGNLTVNAQYTAQTYTVTFNLDGKGTRTGGGALVQTIAHGTAATAPTVAANTGWVFTGWDKTFNNITGNLTVNAQYTAQTYTVTFNLDNKGTRTGGGALVQTIAHGTAATAPTVAANTGWVFTGWDKTFNNITGNLTVNAQYTAQTYTVTFNLDGKGTRTGGGALVQTIGHGTAATAPTVAANTGWVFTGWDKTFNNITGNLTVNAQYTAQTYTVTFNLDNKGTRTGGGTLIQTIAHGTAATAPTVAANTGWVFTGWDKAFNNVTGNLTVNAQYTGQTYTVTFNLDGKGTRTGGGALVQTIAHGAAATAPTVAANTGWNFTGWDKAFNNVTGNLTVNAQYTGQTYTVTFNLDGKGTRTGGGALVQTIAHGAAATVPTVAANTGWVFTGWDKAFNSITGNLTVNAQYTAQTYTVTFNLDNKGTRTGGGTLIQTIAHGGAATAPTVAASTGWVFTGWDKSFNNITGNLTVNAQYTAQTYTLNILSANGSVTKRVNGVITTATSFAHGTVVELIATAHASYTFANWSGSTTGTANPVSITMDGNKSVTANYTQTAGQSYTLAIAATNGSVTVKVNGAVTTATSFEAGTVVELTAIPNSNYTFGSWSGSATGTHNPLTITIDGNKSITANFTTTSGGRRSLWN